MPQHIKIHTDFDITETGVVRNYKEGILPRKVRGMVINSKEEWIKCRRQQSNWETLIQTISLRTQPYNLRTISDKSGWTLEFDIEYTDAYALNGDKLGLLKQDLNNVPLLTGLDEHKTSESSIVVDGKNQNIRFDAYEL